MQGEKLTLKQTLMLKRVVETNGGGVSTYDLNAGERRIVMALHDKGLVQGQSGKLYRVVHTKEGRAALTTQGGGDGR